MTLQSAFHISEVVASEMALSALVAANLCLDLRLHETDHHNVCCSTRPVDVPNKLHLTTTGQMTTYYHSGTWWHDTQ